MSKKLQEKFTKAEIEELYITQNMRFTDLAVALNLSAHQLSRLLQEYGIKKDHQLITHNKKQTMRKHYGVDFPLQSSKIKDRTRMTVLKKYGVDNPGKSKTVQEKMQQTNLDRRGVAFPGQSTEVQQKMKKTCLNRYGTETFSGSQNFTNNWNEYGQQRKQTCLEKYGVEEPCQLTQCQLAGNNSKPNRTFEELLINSKIPYEREYPLDNRSYDFKVGELLIEINPSATHNSTWAPRHTKIKSRDYHYQKSILARDNGFRCIHVYDWDSSQKIINTLLKPKTKVGARQCVIREVPVREEKLFLEEYHLQGYVKSNHCYGLYRNNELLAIMSFGTPRYNKQFQYEILRYCSCKIVVGGAEKLFSAFVKQHNPKNIISYCDLNKFDGNVYKTLGFKEKNVSITRHWYHLRTKKHITDNLLRKRGFDQLLGKEYGFYGKGSSNEQLMIENGFVEVYDAGQMTFVWQSEQ